MIREILALCSRDNGHDAVYTRLSSALATFERECVSWDDLIHEAEKQGVTPLLHKHISECGYNIPVHARRLLQTLFLRHQRSNQIRNAVIKEILTLFRENNIALILLKGIALSNMVYQDPGLRPMRDIDILVRPEDVHDAQKLLLTLGFNQVAHADINDDHHHLEPLTKSENGLPITIEVHRELLPKQLNSPFWSYENIEKTKKTFFLDGVEAYTLSVEHTLQYEYLHGFKAPLTYEPFRLVHVADLVSLVEFYFEEIDWIKLKSDFPAVLTVLSRLHFLTPWHSPAKEFFSSGLKKIPDSPGVPYSGWPQRPPNTIRAYGIHRYLRDTLWPSQWWIQMHYGKIDGWAYLRARLFEHPRTLWRWVKILGPEYWRAPRQ